jgi:hypothetical protein
MDRNKEAETAKVVEPTVVKTEEVQPEVVMQTSTPVQKSGGKGKWIACCLILVILCCCCTVATSYITFFKTVDAIKFIAKSDKNTTLTYLKPTDVSPDFDWDTYIKQNTPKDLGNGTSEVYLTEEFLLKLFMGDPKYNYMADYVGIKIKKDLMIIQIDAGSIIAEEVKKGNTEMPEGFTINPEDLRKTYVNIELSTTSDHKEVSIKTVKIGDSFFDLNTFFPDAIKEIEAEVRKSDTYEDIKEIEFLDGKIRMIIKDDVSNFDY